jgi:hypothetical protein
MIYLPIGMKPETAPAPRGRPRAFDPDAALDRAMHVFWAKVTKALHSRISPEPCKSIDQVFTPPLATRSNSLEKVLDRFRHRFINHFLR